MSYPAPPFNQHVGRLIRDARAGAGITQATLALRLGVDKSAVAHWELGHALPRLDTFSVVCAELGIDVGQLVAS